MRKQWIPGSLFPPPTESLGTRLVWFEMCYTRRVCVCVCVSNFMCWILGLIPKSYDLGMRLYDCHTLSSTVGFIPTNS